MTYKTSTASPDASLELGARIGRLLQGDEFIELIGDVGAGKTLITRGILQGAGYEGEVTSPTFTISRIYNLPQQKRLYHFDFYRLNADEDVARSLAEADEEDEAIVVVEWPATIAASLPGERVRLSMAAENEDAQRREVTVESLGGKFDYVVEGLR